MKRENKQQTNKPNNNATKKPKAKRTNTRGESKQHRRRQVGNKEQLGSPQGKPVIESQLLTSQPGLKHAARQGILWETEAFAMLPA